MSFLDSDTDTVLIVSGVVFGVMILVMSVLAYKFPIRDGDEHGMRGLSIVMALFLFPLYLVWVAVQNPVKTESGKPNYLPTVLVSLLFWPVLFCIMPSDGWDRQRDSYGSGRVRA